VVHDYYVATFQPGLSASMFLQNIVVLATIGSFLFIAAVFWPVARRQDVEDNEFEEARTIAEKGVSWHEKMNILRVRRARAAAEAARNDGDGDGEDGNGVGNATLVSKFFRQTLPTYALQPTLLQSLFHEVKERHDWVSIVYVYSSSYPRELRLVYLVCCTVWLMVANAVAFIIAYPEMHCEQYETEYECGLKPSPIDQRSPACVWDPIARPPVCIFNEPDDSDPTVAIMIALIVGVIMVPFDMALEWIFESLIYPPVGDGEEDEEEDEIAEGLQEEDTKKSAMDAFKTAKKGDAEEFPVGKGKGETNVGGMLKARFAAKWGKGGKVGADPGKEDAPDDDARPGSSSKKGGLSGLMATALVATRWQSEEDPDKAAAKAEIEEETRRAIVALKRRRAELLRANADLEESLAAEPDSSRDVKRSRRKALANVRRMTREFELRWGFAKPSMFGFSQRPVTDEKMFRAAVSKRVTRDVELAKTIQEILEELSPEQQEAKLLEWSRFERLNKLEQKIYVNNHTDEDEEDLDSIHWTTKSFGWLLVGVAGVIFPTIFLIMFGTAKGKATTNAWLFAFLLSFVQNVFLFDVLKIFFMNVYLPSLIREKLLFMGDPTNQTRFPFQTAFPDGPAHRVAFSYAQLHVAQLLLAQSAGQDPSARGRSRHASAHVEEIHHKAWSPTFAVQLAFAFWGVLLVMPDSLQNFVVDEGMPMALALVTLGTIAIWNMYGAIILLPPAIALVGYGANIAIKWRRKRQAKLLDKAPEGSSGGSGGGGSGPGQSQVCVICLDKAKDTAFVPCGHLACCKE